MLELGTINTPFECVTNWIYWNNPSIIGEISKMKSCCMGEGSGRTSCVSFSLLTVTFIFWVKEKSLKTLRIFFFPFSDAQAPSPDIKIKANVMQKCTSFEYLGSVVKTTACDEDVNYGISVVCFKWRENSEVLSDKRMPSKFQGEIYTTVVRSASTYG